ncbi:hypothetical protein ACIBHY_11200 [Nonomuraea sp. NPDC050547]|uniref:hypothetical protein n=1 Tax=unclassified Nonomuraea TaxID=2593643 RepID=UPI0037A3D215
MKIAGLAAALFSVVIAILSFAGDEKGRRVVAGGPSPTSTQRHEPMEVPGVAEPTPTGAATSPSAAVPDRFIGTWVGLVADEDMKTPFPVEILLRQGGLGETIGKVHYESLRCQGVVRLYEVSSRELSVQESLSVSTDMCDEDLVTLRYEANGTLHYSYGAGEGRAVLRRQVP